MMMPNFTIDSAPFLTLRVTPGINLTALARVIEIVNTNRVIGSLVETSVGRNDVRIRVATSDEVKFLDGRGASAFFDFDLADPVNEGRYAVVIHPKWVLGPNAELASGRRGEFSADLAHEFGHYRDVNDFLVARQIQVSPEFVPAAYAHLLSAGATVFTAEQRVQAYVAVSMRAEVLGWYDEMLGRRFDNSGSVTGPLRAINTSEGSRNFVIYELDRLDRIGRGLGMNETQLREFIAAQGAPVLARNTAYWGTYVDATSHIWTGNGVDLTALRARLAFREGEQDPILNWTESGSGSDYRSTITYSSGKRSETAPQSDGSSETLVTDSAGTVIEKRVTTFGPFGKQTMVVTDGNGIELQRTELTRFDDESWSESTRYNDGARTNRTVSSDGGLFQESRVEASSTGGQVTSTTTRYIGEGRYSTTYVFTG